MALPALSPRMFFVLYQGLTARIGLVFLVEAWWMNNPMSPSVYGEATRDIGPLAWSMFFFAVHFGAAIAILLEQKIPALVFCSCSVVAYVALGIKATGAPQGLVVREFSIGLHAAVQALIVYDIWQRWTEEDDGPN